jgi:dTDP-L-rhamnose 4-epimerase
MATALVTGGAGLIGSHIVDLLVAEGWQVRVLDNFEPQTHRNGPPAWLNPHADYQTGDVRSRSDLRAALDGVEVIFHEAAYGGYMPEIAKYIEVNSYGTALLLETIRDAHLPVRKVVVASSQAVYDEGAYRDRNGATFFPDARPLAQLRSGSWEVQDATGRPAMPAPTPEWTPIGGQTVYAISKADQERLVLAWGRQTGIPAVALRYSCTYGPRQSIFNPYTGVIAIFCTRLLNNLAPIVYEDGRQTRDFCFVEDIARANLCVATDARADGGVFNVGSGVGTAIGDLARVLADALGVPVMPEFPGEFRPGEIRHLTSDITRIAALGWRPRVPLAEGIARYLDWIRAQGDVADYFTAASARLRAQRIVHAARSVGEVGE